MSKEIVIIGSTSKELEELLRPAHQLISSAAPADLLRVARATAKEPRVFVVDIRQQIVIPPGLGVLRSEQPGTGVVIVATKLDPVLMLETMRAGVSEWVVDPVKPHELLSAVERAGGGNTRPAGEIFAVVGAKGGVGTTTVAVNVATALSSVAGGRTLVIDLHPGCGDAALFLGVEPHFSLADALENTHRLDEAYLKGIVTKSDAGPDLLASPDRSISAAIDPRKVRAVVEAAARCYRFVVLDVPRFENSLDELLGLAASITVVTTQELSAIRAGTRTAATLKQRHGAGRVRVVLNRYDTGSEIATEDLERAFGGRLGHRFPSNYRLAISALNKGRPVVVDNHNKLASALTAYARSLSRVTPAEEPPADKSAGFFGRLTSRR